MTWVSTTQIQSWTGISASSEVLERSLSFAEKDIIRKIFALRQYESGDSTTKHQIFRPIMSVDGDTTISTTDLEAYEIDSNAYQYSLATYMTEVDEKSGWVSFNVDVPTSSDRTVVIESYVGRDWFDNMLVELQELEKLIATNKFYEFLQEDKLQEGITSWSLNGVSVSFDVGNLQRFIEKNNDRISKLMNQLRIKRFDGFRPGVTQHRKGIIGRNSLTGFGRRFLNTSLR